MPFTPLLLAAALVLAAAPACAQGLTILAAGAVKVAVEEILPAFTTATGIAARADFGTVGAVRDRIAAGEGADVALLSSAAIAALAGQGKLAEGVPIDLGRTGVGIAQRRGGGFRPIGTENELTAALLAAPSISWADPASGATAGIHFQSVIEKLGIAEALKPKARLVQFGVDAVRLAIRGEVELAVSQASEIVPYREVIFLGFLPDTVQAWTPYQAAVVTQGEDARAFVAFLAGDVAKAAFARSGFQPTPR